MVLTRPTNLLEELTRSVLPAQNFYRKSDNRVKQHHICYLEMLSSQLSWVSPVRCKVERQSYGFCLYK